MKNLFVKVKNSYLTFSFLSQDTSANIFPLQLVNLDMYDLQNIFFIQWQKNII